MPAMRLRHTRRRRNPSRHPAPVYGLMQVAGTPPVGVKPVQPESARRRCDRLARTLLRPSSCVQRDMGWGSTPSLFLAGLAAHPWGPSARFIPCLGRACTPVAV